LRERGKARGKENSLKDWEALANHKTAIFKDRQRPTRVLPEKFRLEVSGLQRVDSMHSVRQVFLFKCNPHLLAVHRQRMVIQLHGVIDVSSNLTSQICTKQLV
jgi:hypothetical protein